jgi:uncharacterized protein (TIGR02598 family)
VKREPQRCGSGFALVEIAIAIGIMAFALVAILSLLSVGLKAGRDATDDTVITTMATAVIGQLRATNRSVAQLTALNGTATNYYFDSSGGGWTTNDFGASNASSLYECKVEFTNSFSNTTASSNVILARLMFAWPVQAAPSNRSTKIIHATLTSY